MNPIATQQELLAQGIIKNLEKRHMKGYYCKTADEAKELVSSLIAENSSVTWGGSMTAAELGVTDALKARGDVKVLDRADAKSPEEVQKIYRDAFSLDNYIMSTNAITKDGQLVNIDGAGNRVAALIFGPKQVIVITGMNKVCNDLDEAMVRARNIAAPPNAIRLNQKTPCSVTGSCGDCTSPDCICNQIVITRNSRDPERIKVVLVEGSWGF